MPKKKATIEPEPGELVSSAPEGVSFGPTRRFPYEELLKQLRNSPEKYLRFPSVGARRSLTVRATKLGIPVLFAEHNGELWVKIDAQTKLEPPRKHSTPDELVLTAVRQNRHTSGAILQYVRLNGFAVATIQGVEQIMSNLAHAGKIKFERLDGGTGRWVPA